MIKLTVLVKRNPSLSIEQFHEMWREHGRMIAGDADLRRHIVRYEQHHRAIADYRTGDTYDGLAVQWFEHFSDFLAFLNDPKYVERVQPDEQRLLDMDKLVVLFTEEAETFIP